MNNRKFGFMVWTLLSALTIAKAESQPLATPQIKEAHESPFTDVPKDHWAFSAVEFVFYSGLMEGDNHGHFNGNAPLSRYDFAVIMHRFLRQPGPILANPPAVGIPQNTKPQ